MAETNIYQLTMNTSIHGQQCQNVFFYQLIDQVGTGVSPSEKLAQEFDNQILSNADGFLNDFWATTWRKHGIRVIDLFDLSDLYTLLIGDAAVGTNATATAPSFTAAGFHTPQETRAVRAGQKRFAGVVESATTGDAWTAGFAAGVSTLESLLGSNILWSEAGLSMTFAPVVVKRIKEVDEDGKVSYRLPTNLSESEFFYANSWSLIPRVTSQVSRKARV